MFYVADVSVAEIASMLGCQEGSVKASLFKARQTLTSKLIPAQRGPDER